MSDRRPEHEELSEAFHAGWQALQNDPEALIAVVRRGVESGTIKGEVVQWCQEHDDQGFFAPRACQIGASSGDYANCRIVNRVLLGPVSDGGSET